MSATTVKFLLQTFSFKFNSIFFPFRCEFSTDHGASYQAQREKRWYYLLGYLFYKWNLKMIYDEVGKVLTLNSTGHGTSIMPNVTKYHTNSDDSK